MIGACLALTALTVLLAVPAPAGRATRLRPAIRPAPSGRGGGARAAVVLGLVGAGGVGIAYRTGGASGAVITLALVIAAATVARVQGWRLTRRAAARRRHEVARSCAALAAQVRVGRVPSDALAATAQDYPALGAAHAAQAIGGDVAEALMRSARAPGASGLLDLARAWRLGHQTGASMAGVLDQVALALRRDEAVQRTVAAELAGPRATGKIMAVLPLAGVGMGYLLGGRPVQFLLDGVLGWSCLLAGVVLACVGVLWIERLALVVERG